MGLSTGYEGKSHPLYTPSCAATTISLRQHVAINKANAIPEIPRLIETTTILIPIISLKTPFFKKDPEG
ncbi:MULTISPECIES: hypothetical protein [Rossellomorea]|uniref:hypothetical protein n=1 Tax=Rossellomorea TaxID=2837508 RepID=UPI000AB86CA3|nr:hypothetical protein [Rossellomorea marisflavi]